MALTADASKMYRMVELVTADRDYHRFVWRREPSEPIKDYRMTWATFGVSASCFVANVTVKRNAPNSAHEYPLAAKTVEQSFLADDGLTGAMMFKLQTLSVKAVHLETEINLTTYAFFDFEEDNKK